MAIKSYQDLIVWQKAMDLVQLVYKASKKIPDEERYLLTSQLRRSAISIPSNIAEGQARQSTAEFLNFLSIARGSRAELETQIFIAKRLGYLNPATVQELLGLSEEVSRLLNRLIASLKNINKFV